MVKGDQKVVKKWSTNQKGKKGEGKTEDGSRTRHKRITFHPRRGELDE